jgi:hypothetical protein
VHLLNCSIDHVFKVTNDYFVSFDTHCNFKGGIISLPDHVHSTVISERNDQSYNVSRIFCVNGLDGSGRQVMIMRHKKSFLIKAGCFFGTLSEFVKKAKGENKMYYANGIKALCDALIETEKLKNKID